MSEHPIDAISDLGSDTEPFPGIKREANPPLTPLELMQLPEGHPVYDATGDLWTKEDGKWVCNDARLLPESLIHVWGPITLEEQ